MQALQACHKENLRRKRLFSQAAPHAQVVNIEWPGFAVPELPVLAEDRELDEASNNPGQQQVGPRAATSPLTGPGVHLLAAHSCTSSACQECWRGGRPHARRRRRACGARSRGALTGGA